MAVHSFDCYGTFKVHIGRLLPIGRTEYLAFAEHYHVVGERVAGNAASVVLLDSNILVDNYDLQAAQVRQTLHSRVYLFQARRLCDVQGVSRERSAKFRYFLGLNHKREGVKVHKGVLQANTLFLGLSYDSLKVLAKRFRAGGVPSGRAGLKSYLLRCVDLIIYVVLGNYAIVVVVGKRYFAQRNRLQRNPFQASGHPVPAVLRIFGPRFYQRPKVGVRGSHGDHNVVFVKLVFVLGALNSHFRNIALNTRNSFAGLLVDTCATRYKVAGNL